ncbi:HAMP domain-containing sensor histidine kinase [Limosilactobacillus vaginalis]|uniref:HAMP domain-containing sensor histidine kinase n=1 Tax=Limosilactobacillus vaginalis TaxID=1633 RepID=UPI003AB48299
MEKSQKQKKFFSLKLKWALGTSIGSFLIFCMVAMSLFSAFTQNLLNSERELLNSGMNVINQQLGRSNTTLNKTGINNIIIPEHERDDFVNGQRYRRPIIQELSDSHLIVNIYTPNKQNIFSTGKPLSHAQFSQSKRIREVSGPEHNVLAGTQAIYSNRGHKLIGYLKVENSLNAYYKSYNQFKLVCFFAMLLVILTSGLLGYFLSYFLLQPLGDIHDTVKEISKDPTKNIRVPVTGRNDELAELTAMFNEMLDRMQRYIDQQSQFVGDVSHELRTPVAIIQGHLEMLQRWGKDDPQVLAESLNASLAETKRMKNLVQEMLDLSHAEQVEINFRNQRTVVNDVVHQVFNNFKMLYPEFTFTLDDDLHSPVISDVYRDHLEQVLVILCDNAIKYSQDRKEIHISLSRGMNTVEIGVQDFGEGIAPEDIKKVFDRFYRVDKARSRKKGGNGLGLSIAKRLIEGYHGSITLESSLGAGSIFRIILPIVEDDDIEDDQAKTDQQDNN